jgi:hypothetical protein
MPLVNKRVPALTGGVSQQPHALRRSAQLEEQINGFADAILGLFKRPATEHVALLQADETGFTAALDVPLNISTTDRYRVLVANSTLKVYDAITGESYPVEFPDGSAYLGGPDPESVQHFEFFNDNDGVTLQAHLAEGGYAWTKIAGTSNMLIDEGRIRTSANESQRYGYAYPVPDADMLVEGNVFFDGNTAEQMEIWARKPSPSSADGYYVRVVNGSLGSNTTIALFRVSSSGASSAQIGSTFVIGSTIGGSAVDRKLAIRLTGTFIEALWNGDVVASGVEATHSDAGYVGVGGNGSALPGTQAHIGDLTITTAVPAVSSGLPNFRAVAVGETVYIVNTGRKVLRDSESASSPVNEALVVVRQGDFGTSYAVTLDGITNTLGTTQGVTPQARPEIATDVIAERLIEFLEANELVTGFTFTQYGSTIHITRSDGADFTITGRDGLADDGLLIIKGSVQRFSDLPIRAPSEYVLEITGDPTNAFDNYFVKYDDAETPGQLGVWRECVKPGELIDLDAVTMPHRLVRNASFIDESPSAGAPPTPLLVPGGGSRVTDGFDADFGDDEGTHRVKLDQSEDTVAYAILEDANGIETKYRVHFNVRTNQAKPNEIMRVNVGRLTDPMDANSVKIQLAFKDYGAQLSMDDFIDATYAFEEDEPLIVYLTWPSATPAGDTADDLAIYLHAKDEVTPGVEYIKRTGKTVVFDSERKYPAGAVVAVTVGATVCSYTVPDGDKTGLEVATALELLTEAVSGYSSVLDPDYEAGVLITKDDGTAPTVGSLSLTFSELTTFHNPDLDLTTNELAGKTIKNLTDNSTGTVVSNTETTITVAEMEDGADNKFQKGDTVTVVNPGGTYFVFNQVPWKSRECGDYTNNPFPSFSGKFISDLVYARGRLGFLCEDKIVLSEAGDPTNVFRNTVTQLLDGDVIDVAVAGASGSRLHSATLWNGQVILWSDTQQYVLEGEPLLSPTTVSVKLVSSYPNVAHIRPVVAGRRLFFLAQRGDSVQVYEYRVMDNQNTPEAVCITRHVPRYLEGAALQIVADETSGFIGVHTDDDRSVLYACNYNVEAGQAAWGKWTLPTGSTLVGMDVLDGTLGLIISRDDGVFLETVNLDVAIEDVGHLIDRSKAFASGTGTYSDPNTTWTLPYEVATDGTQGTVEVVLANGSVLSTTRPTATTVRATGDYSAIAVTIGVRYSFTAELSTLYIRKDDEMETPETRGRLQLRSVTLAHVASRDFTVSVTADSRAARSVTFDEAAETDGDYRVPVLTENKQARIIITNATPNPSRFSGLDWEGFYTARGQRV